jgi:hypothetical protein
MTKTVCDSVNHTRLFPERGPPTRPSNVGTIQLKRMIRYNGFHAPYVDWTSYLFHEVKYLTHGLEKSYLHYTN